MRRHQHELELGEKAQSILDNLLAGESPEQKARVLRLVLEMGINPEEEFFALSLALQHLQTLMLDSPQEWRALFSEFQAEQEAWTSSHLNVLKALGQKSQSFAQLTQSSEQLEETLEDVAGVCNELTVRLHSASQSLEGLLAEWPQIRSASLPQTEALKTQVERQEKQIGALTQAIQDLRRDLGRPAFLRKTSWKGTVVAVAAIYAIAFSGVSLVTLMLYLRDRPLLIEMYERTEWLREEE